MALLGVSFLIFIHELGHYFMARRQGITVEVFSIGFGKSIFEWEHKGVKWKVGCLPFGGYVKMAGTEKKGALEPYQIPDGFFAQTPWKRIKVAAMGPIVNIIFAFLAFSMLWAIGGREKKFAEFTQFVGWVDPDSSVYTEGLRPGDQILKINNRSFRGFNDLIYALFLDQNPPKIQGKEIDYFSKQGNDFAITLTNGNKLTDSEKLHTSFIILPANYLIYQSTNNPFEESLMKTSGIEYGDRLVWVDGQFVFSKQNLSDIINEDKALITVKRGEQAFITRVPRLKIADLQLTATEMGELDDWHFETGLKEKIDELYFIPYNLNIHGEVENPISYLDEKSEIKKSFTKTPRSSAEIPLKKGDKILAIDGVHVASGHEILKALQTKQVQVIVQKTNRPSSISWKDADREFEKAFFENDLHQLIRSFGEKPIAQVGNFRLLNPIVPISINEYPFSKEDQLKRNQQLLLQKKQIEQISDSKERERAFKEFEEFQNRKVISIPIYDSSVEYNPGPFTLLGNVFQETWRTLFALVSGYLSPKNISGPVGIVQMIHYGWTQGVKEVLYWLGMISLNLGILNLLPIPVLDGGHISFALFEAVTRKRIKAKTMERLILPFVVLLIGFFIYLTYNDIARIIHRFF